MISHIVHFLSPIEVVDKDWPSHIVKKRNARQLDLFLGREKEVD